MTPVITGPAHVATGFAQRSALFPPNPFTYGPESAPSLHGDQYGETGHLGVTMPAHRVRRLSKARQEGPKIDDLPRATRPNVIGTGAPLPERQTTVRVSAGRLQESPAPGADRRRCSAGPASLRQAPAQLPTRMPPGSRARRRPAGLGCCPASACGRSTVRCRCLPPFNPAPAAGPLQTGVSRGQRPPPSRCCRTPCRASLARGPGVPRCAVGRAGRDRTGRASAPYCAGHPRIGSRAAHRRCPARLFPFPSRRRHQTSRSAWFGGEMVGLGVRVCGLARGGRCGWYVEFGL